MGAPTIDVCIAGIGAGRPYVEFLVRNVLSLADDPGRLRFLVSHHTDEDREQLEGAFAISNDVDWVFTPSVGATCAFFPSANHSRAINALVERSRADVVLIIDHDMALLVPAWDRTLCELLLHQGLDILGVAYPPIAMSVPPKLFNQKLGANVGMVAWALQGLAMKYQNLPNLSFFAMSRNVIERCFQDSPITRFDEFLINGGIPFRLINSNELSKETNLPKGVIQWLDTGYELTEAIARHRIRYHALPMSAWDSTEVFRDRAVFGPLNYFHQPEVYTMHGSPFVAHFRKGSMKSLDPVRSSQFRHFQAAIDDYVGSREAVELV